MLLPCEYSLVLSTHLNY